jgi:iron-sulfur cluster repair protein YtfE (RIC family)
VLVTEPLRAEHRELVPRLAELDQRPSTLAKWSAPEAEERLGRILGFLRDHLVPHAAAEEAVLYPAVEDAMGAPGATGTMRADHSEIVARLDRLADTVADVAGSWPAVELIDEVANQLAGLSAIVGLHFRKEEDVLLPVLDRVLSPEAAGLLFARMGEAAHGR